MTIGLFQSIILVFLPTVPTYLILRDRLRIPWLLIATPFPVMLLAGVIAAMVTMMQRMVDAPPPPEGMWVFVGVLLGAWLLAFVFTLAMLAATVVLARISGAKPPRS